MMKVSSFKFSASRVAGRAGLAAFCFLLSAFRLAAADVLVTVADFELTASTNRRVMLTPMDARVSGPVVVSLEPRTLTVTNGAATFTNVVAGAYKLDISGAPPTNLRILVPDTNITVSAAALLVVVTPGPAGSATLAWAAGASDQRYVSGVTVSSLASTSYVAAAVSAGRVTYATNAGTATAGWPLEWPAAAITNAPWQTASANLTNWSALATNLLPTTNGFVTASVTNGLQGALGYTPLTNTALAITNALATTPVPLATSAAALSDTVWGGISNAATGGDKVTIGNNGNVGIGTAKFDYLAFPWSSSNLAKVVIQGNGYGINDTNNPLVISDRSNRVAAIFNTSGRLDLIDHDSYGGVMVLHNQAAATNGQVAGHYAYSAKNSAGNMNTVGTIYHIVDDVTETSMDSHFLFGFQAGLNTSGSYKQPNANVTLGWDGLRMASFPVTEVSYLGGTTFSLSGTNLTLKNYDPYATANFSDIQFWHKGESFGGGPYPLSWIHSTVEGDVKGGLQFITRNGAGEFNTFTITAAGFVGIGTTNPVYQLDVNGDLRASGGDLYLTGSRITDSVNGGYMGIRPQGNSMILHDGSSTMTMEVYSGNTIGAHITGSGVSYINSGNVGIGTTTPSSKLDVAGTITATNYLLSFVRWVDSPMVFAWATGGGTAPSLVANQPLGGITSLGFDDGDKLDFVSQINHNVAPSNSALYIEPHLHVQPLGTIVSTAKHTDLTIIYGCANIFGAIYGPITNTLSIAMTNGVHALVDFPHLNATNWYPGISAQIFGTITRTANAGTNATIPISITGDFHYPVDRFGSAQDSTP